MPQCLEFVGTCQRLRCWCCACIARCSWGRGDEKLDYKVDMEEGGMLWQQVCSSSCIFSQGTKFAAYCSSHFNIVLHCVCTLCREVCYVFWICYSGNHVRFWWVTHDECQPMMNLWPMAWVQVLVGVGMHLSTCGFTHAIHYLDFAIWRFQIVSDTVLYWHPNLGTLSVESGVFSGP